MGADVPPLNKAIVFRAMADIGICEMPPSSNRSGRIDTYNRRAGSPVASYWCASEATACYVDAGADVPQSSRASCDIVMAWAKKNGLWVPKAQATVVLPGWMVLYGTDADAYHVGIIIRGTPYQISAEGNSAFRGKFSRNGEAMLVQKVELERVVGYVKPRSRMAA